MQSLASFTMRGRSQATLVAAASAMLSLIVPLVGLISSAVIALVTLRKGAEEGLVVGAFAGFAGGLLAFAALGSPWPAVGFVLILWLPVWVLGLVLRQARSLTLTVQVAALFGLLVVAGIRLLAADPAADWMELLEPVRRSLVESSVIDAAVSEQLVARAARWMTGAFAATFYLQLLLALFMGRWWQALLYNPGGFGAEFRALRVRSGVAYPALGLAVVVLLLDEAMWATELLLLLAPLFFLQGVAIVHSLVHTYSTHRGWLIGFYGLLLLATPYAEILVAGFGFLDSWVDLRTRVAARKKG
ncbi:hypothetical protein [Candidatus Thiosymbion oneisti]|uniref:hypothetical protein n=2 Tax=Candidatus Thiosymbion oneisti TaxID=589554 RepID=UPI00105FA729